MSHPKTPNDKITIEFDCSTCQTTYWIAQECIDKYECDGQPLELMYPECGIPTRCSACVRVSHAITQLKNLVVMKPYLLTEGLAGEDDVPKWDKEPGQSTRSNSAEESLGDGMDGSERKKFLEKMVQSFQDTAGKGMTEQEVYRDGGKRDLCESLASKQIVENGVGAETDKGSTRKPL